MSSNGKKALHVATFSGWYRFEQDGKEFKQTKRDLTYWTLTCMSVDPANSQKIYAGSEHSGLFYTENGGARWQRCEPNTPKMMLFSALALNDGVLVGTIPSAVYRSKNGKWEELEGVRIHSAGANFPVCSQTPSTLNRCSNNSCSNSVKLPVSIAPRFFCASPLCPGREAPFKMDGSFALPAPSA